MHLLLPGVINKTKNAQKSQTLTNGMISLKTRETAHRLSQIGGFVVTYFFRRSHNTKEFFLTSAGCFQYHWLAHQRMIYPTNCTIFGL